MYPDRDTIAQLLRRHAVFVCLFVFAIRLFRYITKHLMYGPSGNSQFCFPSSPDVSYQDSRENKTNCFPRNHTYNVKFRVQSGTSFISELSRRLQ